MVTRLGVGAFILALGCMRWSGVPANATPNPTATLRLLFRDGTSVIVKRAVVSDDSIVGVPWGSVSADARFAVARTQVVRVEVGQRDASKAELLVVGLTFLVVGTVLYVLTHQIGYWEPK